MRSSSRRRSSDSTRSGIPWRYLWKSTFHRAVDDGGLQAIEAARDGPAIRAPSLRTPTRAWAEEARLFVVADRAAECAGTRAEHSIVAPMLHEPHRAELFARSIVHASRASATNREALSTPSSSGIESPRADPSGAPFRRPSPRRRASRAGKDDRTARRAPLTDDERFESSRHLSLRHRFLRARA